MRVYLSGGQRSGWQREVMAAVPGHHYVNPGAHGLTVPNQYTLWDWAKLDTCDILFAYMESDNPSGYGLAAEVGYAKAKGKKVILVDARSPVDDAFKRYSPFIHNTCDVVFDCLDDALILLDRLTVDT